MTANRRYGYGFGDFFRDALQDMNYGFSYFPPNYTSYSITGELVDTSKYDIVPKQEYREKLVKQKEEEIESLERQHESQEKYYKNRKAILEEEKESLIRAVGKNKNDKDD